MASPLLQAGNGFGLDLLLLATSFVVCVLALLGFAHLARPRSSRRAGSLPLPPTEAALKAYIERNELC